MKMEDWSLWVLTNVVIMVMCRVGWCSIFAQTVISVEMRGWPLWVDANVMIVNKCRIGWCNWVNSDRSLPIFAAASADWGRGTSHRVVFRNAWKTIIAFCTGGT